MRRLQREHGQSSVELIALLPLTLVLALGVFALLSARSAAGQAAAAAQAGAMAVLQDGDPAAAARAALPSGARERATIRVDRRRISVTVRPAAEPGILRGTLSATASADAGPEPRP
jgi:hypothetical protein